MQKNNCERVASGLFIYFTFILITAVQECIVTAETQPKPNQHGTTAVTTHPELDQKLTSMPTAIIVIVIINSIHIDPSVSQIYHLCFQRA